MLTSIKGCIVRYTSRPQGDLHAWELDVTIPCVSAWHVSGEAGTSRSALDRAIEAATEIINTHAAELAAIQGD